MKEIINSVRIVLPDHVLEQGAVVIAEGRIERLAEQPILPVTAGEVELNLAGCTLYPGFIDVHIHGAAGVDVMNATAEDLHSVSRFLAENGVSGWLPTFVPAGPETYSSAVRAIEQAMIEQETNSGNSPAARILGLHYEGPFVNNAQCGALHIEHFRSYANPQDVAALPTPAAKGAVRMITVAPEIDGGVELVRELTKEKWLVSIGHTRASVAVLDAACDAGAHHMTHFMNAMAPLHHRAPGPIGWGLARKDVTCDVIADGIHLDPFMLWLLHKLKSPERLVLISDAIAATGLGPGDYQIWGETISVAEGRTRNVHGSIAGSVITMLDAVRLMLKLGLPETDVARMAASNPARLLGIEDDCGSIAEGKRADLVALDHEGTVSQVFVGGVGVRARN